MLNLSQGSPESGLPRALFLCMGAMFLVLAAVVYTVAEVERLALTAITGTSAFVCLVLALPWERWRER